MFVIIKIKKSLFYKIFSLIVSILIISVVFLLFFNRNHFICIPVVFDRNDFPLIDVNIENQTYSLHVNIGSRFPLFLNKEILEGINKSAKGMSEVKNIEGKRYEVPTYQIPKIKIGDIVLTDVNVNQSVPNSNQNSGKIGKFLGTELNLLLDFPHSRIIICDSFSKLKKKIHADNWLKIPFEMDRAGVILKVNTDLGIMRLSLNTGSTTTGLRSSLVKNRELWQIDSKSIIFHSNIFSIGEKEFNGLNFSLFEITPDLKEIDGSIGVDFLKKHAIYIDYRNKFVYLEPPKDYFERIPISFGPGKIPYIKAEIEGNSYSLEFDLGSGALCTLHRKILSKINKDYEGIYGWMDFKGNKYESPCYIIPKLKIENLAFDNVLVKQDREDFHVSATIDGDVPEQDGVIGRPFLEKFNLFLDFRNAAIFPCSSFSKLKGTGLISEKFVKAPFILDEYGIILNIETDIGVKRFCFDTGATGTILNKALISTELLLLKDEESNLFRTSKFKIGENDFGETKFFLLELDPSFEFDGILGMDFLKKHSTYIDYFNRFIYLNISNAD